jgi:hypothetical protein
MGYRDIKLAGSSSKAREVQLKPDMPTTMLCFSNRLPGHLFSVNSVRRIQVSPSVVLLFRGSAFTDEDLSLCKVAYSIFGIAGKLPVQT